jgi:hypothetical protein
MSWSLVQGVLPTFLDKETEVKREVSWMLHAPVSVKKDDDNNNNNNNNNNIFFFICAVGLWVLRPLLAYCTSPGW